MKWILFVCLMPAAFALNVFAGEDSQIPDFLNPEYRGSLDQGGDSCANATVILSLPYCDEGTTYWYADNYTPPCGPSGGRDVVYRYHNLLAQTVTISLCGSYFNTILHVWRGCPNQGGSIVCCNDNTSCAPNGTASCCQSVSLPVLPIGQYYYIIVDGAGFAAAGHYILNVVQNTSTCYDVHCTGTPPPNDLCANRINLPNPNPAAQWINGYSIGATLEITPVCAGESQVAPGVWYKVTGNGETITVTTCDMQTDYDTKLSVFCNTCDDLICVTANDNFNIPVCGYTSLVSWCTEADREYMILVHGAQSWEVGKFRLGYWTDGLPCTTPPVCTLTPSNDLCVNAIQLTTPVSPYSVLGTTIGATWDNAPCCVTANTAPGVWYAIVGNGTTYTISTCSANTSGGVWWDTKLSVYCNTCTNLSCVDGNNDWAGCMFPGGLSQVSWCSVAGEQYYILVHGNGNASGNFEMDVMSDNMTCSSAPPCLIPSPPPNDHCNDAIMLTQAGVVPQSIRGSTIGASQDNAPFCVVADAGSGVWYKLTGDGHRVWMTTCNEYTECIGYDTRLSVYCGDCDGLTCVTGNDDLLPCPPMSEVIWCTEPGRDYYILVHGLAGIVGNFQLDWWEDATTCTDPPVCTSTGDSCADAINIPAIPYCTEGTTWWSADNYMPPCGFIAGGRDRVYKIRLTYSEQVTISLCGSYFDTILHIWMDCPDAGGQLICCNNDFQCDINGLQSCCPNVILQAYTTYYIIVDGNGANAAGHYILNITQGSTCPSAHCPGIPPPNDLCQNALLLPPGATPQWVSGWTIGATLDNTSVCAGESQVAPGVWYKIIGTGNTMTVTTCDPYTDYDTKITVFCGSCEDLICVSANDNFNIPVCGMTSKVDWCSRAGEEYYVLVHGAQWYEVGNFRLGWWDDGIPCSNPPNCVATGDSCEDAIRIPSIPFCDEGTTWWYADNYQPSCAEPGGNDRVYKYTPSHTEVVNVSLCGSYFDTVIHVWLDCPTYGGQEICCNNDYPCPIDGLQSCCERVVLMGNQTYYIIVDGNGPNAKGHYILNITPNEECPSAHCPGIPPPNDSCNVAILLPNPSNGGQWVAGWTIGATLDNTPVCAGEAQVAPGVWYKIIGNGNTMTVTTCDQYTDFDTKLSVFCHSCDTLVCISANDNFNIPICGMTSLVSWCTRPGEEYYILVHGAFWYEVGKFKIGYWHDDLPCDNPPACEPCVADFSVVLDCCYGPMYLSGSTIGAGNDCNTRPSQDQIWELHVQQACEFRFDMCQSSLNWNSYLYLDPRCCSPVHFAENDDGCPSGNSMLSYIDCILLQPGVYYLLIEGFNPLDAGDYWIEVTCCCHIQHTEFSDLGDLPSCNYPTLPGNPGHELSGIAWLGPCITGEFVPLTLNRDTCDDGVVYHNPNGAICATQRVTVTVTGGQNYGYYVEECCGCLWLNGWCDGNFDGDFCDDFECPVGFASEWIVRDVQVWPGSYDFSFLKPGTADVEEIADLYRWRLTSQPVGRYGFGKIDQQACPQMICGTFDYDFLGEVEDYILVTPPHDLVVWPQTFNWQATHVKLWWRPVWAALTYYVYRDTTTAVTISPATLIGTTTDTTYVDPIVAGYPIPAPKYFYQVTASSP
jgi:hypothetical protein